MDSIVILFSETLGKYISKEATVLIISMLPILELRGGLLSAKLLSVPLSKAIPLCVIGNMIPIPFILLFIKRIFAWLKKFKTTGKFVKRLEERAMKRSDSVTRYEIFGLVLFVGIPLPGTGAWTGSLIASLLNMDIKRASISILLGIAMATVIMSFVAYGLLGFLIG